MAYTSVVVGTFVGSSNSPAVHLGCWLSAATCSSGRHTVCPSFLGGRPGEVPSPELGASVRMACTSVVVAVSRLSGNVHTGGVYGAHQQDQAWTRIRTSHANHLSDDVLTGGVHRGITAGYAILRSYDCHPTILQESQTIPELVFTIALPQETQPL